VDDGTAAEQEETEEPMNVRQGSWGQAIVAALVVAVITVAVNKTTDHHDETATATSIATLTERVSTLTEQVRRLNEQPYARREDLNAISNRVDGLERRIDIIEREQQPNRHR
jgi:polyhydroxyalkanoate synthesis regulator phasin